MGASKYLSIAVLGLLTAVSGTARAGGELPQDQGAAGLFQKIQKLRTTASAMHTTAHPDDEHGGVLALLSRGQGARLALMTLNRGESGDNAIGSELFDGLGLIRTEELIDAGRYYGLDDQYFTTVADYGFSKTLDEALAKWGKENVLRDVVRIIRINRPFVLVSRFQGNQRDGHGNHQTAGMITQEAFKAAGDPNRFPEQIAEGLRPWQPMKVYIGGQRENEEWNVRVDPGVFSPWLSESYTNFSRFGLALQRSQTSGRLNTSRGPQYGYYKRVGTTIEAKAKEEGFFDGIDTSIPGLFKTLGRTAPAGADEALAKIDREVTNAAVAFSMTNPSATVPALARGLKATRDAIALVGAGEPDAAFVLRIKERQFESAIATALGIDFKAMAQAAGLPEPTGPFAEFAAPPTMPAPVPGQTFEIRSWFTNRSGLDVTVRAIEIATGAGWEAKPSGSLSSSTLKSGATAMQRFAVTISNDAPLTSKPYFTRASIQDARYEVADKSQLHRPSSLPPAIAVAKFTVEGVDVEAREVVTRREANLPYGYELRELRTVPALALTVTPGSAVVPLKALRKRVTIEVDLLNNLEGEIAGEVALKLPAGWTSSPAAHPFKYARAGERAAYRFTVSIPSIETKSYEIKAVAKANGREYSEGYDVIEKRDLETRFLYRPSTISVRGIDVNVPSGLKIGYVMGVGDQVPAGLAQLGASVTLLGEKDLATANLSQFDTIMTGTRAYAVREDLKTYNQRLMDYVKGGGNMVVLYNTQEFVPDKWAPYPAQLIGRAEEVSEEDSPVDILAPNSPALTYPNRITPTDFENWVEQRGSKFWSSWDKAYTPIIATWDKGQEKQQGGWLHATYGKGHYTYFAYAFHRQLPYGVPGAYRLLGNILSLNKAKTPAVTRPKP